MADRFDIGDIITMKKPHPCGSKEWEVLRVGADFRLKCVGCGHQIMVDPQISRKKHETNRKKDLKLKRLMVSSIIVTYCRIETDMYHNSLFL